MEVVVDTKTYGKVVFYENAWTGKKRLYCQNKECRRVAKNTFQMGEKGTEWEKDTAWVRGNFLRGAKLHLKDEIVELTPALKWYEYILAFWALVFDLIWANIPATVLIIPMVGGAIGGLICGVAAVVTLYYMHTIRRTWGKVLLGVGVGLVALVICFVIGYCILLAAAAMQGGVAI